MEFSVAFLDKIICLSSADAMEKFIKNPRPFLLPPLPRPPCKLCVVGPPLSGKTQIAHLLAQKYNAKVIDVGDLLKPHLEREKGLYVEQVRRDTSEKAIAVITAREKEKLELELAKKQAAAAEAAERAAQLLAAENKENEEEDDADKDEEPGDKDKEVTQDEVVDADEVKPEGGQSEEVINAESNETENEETKMEEEKQREDTSIAEAPVVAEEEEVKEIVVNEEHPDVMAMVEAAVTEVEKQTTSLPVEAMTEILEQYLNLFEKKMYESNRNGPEHGGWILDNHPTTRDQCTAMIERGLVPDDVVCLSDASDSNFLLRRWYKLNKQSVDERIELRHADEERIRRDLEEEQKRKDEEERLLKEEEARAAEEQRRLEMGDDNSDEEAEIKKKKVPTATLR